MTEFKRADRVADLIRTELAEILLKEVRDPRISSLTITGVKLSDDLRVARVYIVEMGKDSLDEQTAAGLKKATGFLRRELGKRLMLRHVPEIIFTLDRSFAYGSRIDRLLNEIHETEDKDASEDK
ncbi:MAG: 30S ribosome-binding factor RbfA [Smithellaceae bacterium]|nr:30S ribosome-binding factor RbfA [Smithellaceae bacterium]